MLALLLTLAAQGGVAIGHPNIHIADTDLDFDTLEIEVTDLVLRRCNGQIYTETIDDTLAAGDTLVLPTGCFDRARLLTTGLYASGNGGGGTFELDLDVDRIELPPTEAFEIPGSTESTFEISGEDWVTVSLLDLDPCEHRIVDASDPLHDYLVEAVEEYSSLSW